MTQREFPPGWYRPKDQPEVERYWDGSKWTDAYRTPPPRKQRGTLTFWKVVLAIMLAAALINGILAAGGHDYLGKRDSNDDAAPSYQVVPCETNPDAIGC